MIFAQNNPPSSWNAPTTEIAVVGVVIGVINFLFLFFKNRREKKVSQAHFGYGLIDSLFFKESECYELLNHIDADKMNVSDLGKALESRNQNPGEEYRALNTRFDTLLLFLDRLSHALKAKLTTFDVVSMPLTYYVKILAKQKKPIETYIKEIGYTRVIELLNRFPDWKKAK